MSFPISIKLFFTGILDEYEQVSSQLSDKQIAEMKIISRGHLGVPEEILKAGAAQYASMCGNINNKVSISNRDIQTSWSGLRFQIIKYFWF